jgi:hypothetical protein
MGTISGGVARELAVGELADLFEGEDVEIIDDQTVENDLGWVFFYESRAAPEATELDHRLAGNAPVLVRHDGLVVMTGTAFPVEDYLDVWRRAAATEESGHG